MESVLQEGRAARKRACLRVLTMTLWTVDLYHLVGAVVILFQDHNELSYTSGKLQTPFDGKRVQDGHKTVMLPVTSIPIDS